MRTIEFRGKNIVTGEWRYGCYHYSNDGKYSYITAREKFIERLKHYVPEMAETFDEMVLYSKEVWQVLPETVGQFTGLTDKNGNKIFEGDLLRYPEKDNWEKINYSCFEVFFHDGDANSDYNIGYSINRMHNHGSVCGGFIPSFKPKTVSKMHIIGNIHDNPELL